MNTRATCVSTFLVVLTILLEFFGEKKWSRAFRRIYWQTFAIAYLIARRGQFPHEMFGVYTEEIVRMAGLVAGMFVYQALTKKDWSEAIENSFLVAFSIALVTIR